MCNSRNIVYARCHKYLKTAIFGLCAADFVIPIMGAIIPIMGVSQLGLSNVLFSKVRQRVLGLLYLQIGRSYHTNEIIRFTRSGTGAVQRELVALSYAGLLTVKVIGNQKHYEANRSSPLFSELRSIILKTFGLADVLRQVLTPVISQVQVAFIYGSVAKQEDIAKSDIDLMLVSDNLTYADLFKLLEKAEKQLGRTINPTFYSPKDWMKKAKAGNNFVTQVIKQPKIFLIGTENDITKLGKSS